MDLDDDGNSSRTIIIKHNIGVRVKQRDTLAPKPPALLFKLCYVHSGGINDWPGESSFPSSRLPAARHHWEADVSIDAAQACCGLGRCSLLLASAVVAAGSLMVEPAVLHSSIMICKSSESRALYRCVGVHTQAGSIAVVSPSRSAGPPNCQFPSVGETTVDSERESRDSDAALRVYYGAGARPLI